MAATQGRRPAGDAGNAPPAPAGAAGAGHGFPYGIPFVGSLNDGPGFAGPDAPTEADLYRCVHCGLCLSACPTYVETRLEAESPRGRIALMKAVHEGRAGISDRLVSHWELCLQCRACEAVCPSGVPYGRLMEHTRAQARAHAPAKPRIEPPVPNVPARRPAPQRPSPFRRPPDALLPAVGLADGGTQIASAPLTARRPGGSGSPNAGDGRARFFRPGKQVYPAIGPRRMTVGLLSGCVMPLMQGDAMRAAVRVLQRNGCAVAVPPAQGCCGALNRHAGDLELGRQMARRNIDAFRHAGVDRILTASAGCGSSMKEYDDLLHDDADYAAAARGFRPPKPRTSPSFWRNSPWTRPGPNTAAG